ncbi:MAG: hypothetical protein IH948_04055 [Bacteroidetes bacterium]|nr:hypothetical protein [Bacteroidota bacterium]
MTEIIKEIAIDTSVIDTFIQIDPQTIETGTDSDEIIAKQEDNTTTKEESSSSSEKTKALITKYAKFNDGSIIDLEQGEKIVCMFSLTCGHCQAAYKDLCAMQKDGGLPKLYLITAGTEYDLIYFFNQAGDCKDTYMRLEHNSELDRLLEGEDFPRIIAFKDGDIIKTWNTETYSDKALREFYQIVKKPRKKPGEVIIDNSNSPW